jgi:hypothetical protein
MGLLSVFKAFVLRLTGILNLEVIRARPASTLRESTQKPCCFYTTVVQYSPHYHTIHCSRSAVYNTYPGRNALMFGSQPADTTRVTVPYVACIQCIVLKMII